MDVHLNNSPDPADTLGANTVGELLTCLQEADPDRLVVGIRFDGLQIGQEQLAEIMALAMTEPGRLDLEIDSTRTLAAQALGQAANALEDNRPCHETIAQLIAIDKPTEAMNLLNECFTCWNQVERSLTQAAQAAGIDLQTPVAGGAAPAAMIQSLQVLLDQIRQSLQIRDFVAVGDLVEYDMDIVTDGWQQMLVNLQQSLLA